MTCCQLTPKHQICLHKHAHHRWKDSFHNLSQSWDWLIDSAAGADLKIVLSLLALGLLLRQLERQPGGLHLSILKTLIWPICTI